MTFSAATVLDEVKAGTPLARIAHAHSMDEIFNAVMDGKQGMRYGVSSLDDAGLRRVAGIEPWSVAMVVGHALRADEDAHTIARSLALGRVPREGALRYGEPGESAMGRDALLAAIAASEARLAETRVLAAGGPTFAHKDLGELDARGWVLFIGLHDALHLHQAAAIVRTPR
ncbi:MAG: DinB family protein [Chloroflexi bacterium]|nr:DinB family protein [Chloroflexota bacterium]